MLDWFRFKKYPPIWQNYLANFKKNSSLKDFEDTRFVVFDTETTGLDFQKDKILSIGAVSIINKTIAVENVFEIYIKVSHFNVETVTIHGILQEGNIHKVNENEAIELFLQYIGSSILVGHHIGFDIAMINNALQQMKLGKLKNKTIDTGTLYTKLRDAKNKNYSLDELSKEFAIAQHDRHTAAGDALITALLFLKILNKLKTERKVHFDDLFIHRNADGGLI